MSSPKSFHGVFAIGRWWYVIKCVYTTDDSIGDKAMPTVKPSTIWVPLCVPAYFKLHLNVKQSSGVLLCCSNRKLPRRKAEFPPLMHGVMSCICNKTEELNGTSKNGNELSITSEASAGERFEKCPP